MPGRDVNRSDEVNRTWKIERWERAWLALSLAVLFGLVAHVVFAQADRVLRSIAEEERIAAPFENPACAPLLKGPVEQLPSLETLDPESPCRKVIAYRVFMHKWGKPSEISPGAFRTSRGEHMKRLSWGLNWHTLEPFLLAMAFLPSLYGVGLIAARLWRRGAGRSARDGAAPE